MIYTLMSIHLFAHATTSAGDADLITSGCPMAVGVNVTLWQEQVDTNYDIC